MQRAAVATTGAPAPRILTPGLIGIIAVAWFNYFAMGIITVSLPHEVTQLGGGSLAVGAVVGSMFVSAVFARPSVGRFGARVGRRYLVLAGAGIDAVCFALYGQVPNLVFLALLRLVNGLGEAMFYTGSATLVTDLVAPSRRTEAVSYYSVSVYLGTGLGPSVGVFVARHYGLDWAFGVAGAFAALAALLATQLPSPAISTAPMGKLPWVSRRAVVPGAALAFGTAGIIGFSAYMPLYADHLHYASVQYVFLTYSGVIVLVRLLGRVHQLDPMLVARGATMAIITGLCVVAAVPNIAAVYVGTVIFASGIAVQFPALMGLALRDAPDYERASVVGTYTAFMDLSQGLSGFILGAATAVAGYRASFGGGAVMALIGLTLLLARQRRAAAATLPAVIDEPAGG